MGYKLFLAALLLNLGFAALKGQSTDTLTVHFDFNQADLRPMDREALDRRLGPSVSRITAIELAGYCDSAGEAKYNDSLSRQRIASVRKYLQSKGVADTIFRVLKPYGKRNPLNDNGDEEKRSQNRRVTIAWQTIPPSGGALREALKDTASLVGKTIVLNVLFYSDMHRPLPASYVALQQLLTQMQERPGLRIEIQGHVCCVPPEMDGRDIETKNSDLSVQRAKTVYNFLASHGIDTSRISYKGFGASKKIYPQELNETQMMRNRRVEIKIVAW